MFDWWPGMSLYRSTMPRASRGNRIPLTIRLPFDLYREVAVRAKARNWSLSDYVAYCVAREIADKHTLPEGRREILQVARDMSWVAEPWSEVIDG